MPQPALWGGVECTVNRVGDTYLDQLARSGHPKRLQDFDLFAELGIRVLRFPALWERLAPDSPDAIDWSWTDRALERMRELGLRPIVGLVHHGSGPYYTSLLDPAFPDKLARYARRFAERYPWIDAYTPVNEPLTTARFSGQYGLWYPHGRDAASFLDILLNECCAVVAAMRAIETVNPKASLVQTEDLGLIRSTAQLAYQAQFENERRWLSLDLLCGAVDRNHPLYRWIRDHGAVAERLEWLRQCPRIPDVIGINHYVTSNRFLDESAENYPACTHGGNGRHQYADVEAVRVAELPFVGPAELLMQAWHRFGLPLAVTETHLGCTREEQMRWLVEVWNGAQQARREGADVRAVTVWSLLGAFDWNSLVTADRGHYESGAFDLRSGEPRPTALCEVIRTLAHGRTPAHPALDVPGWWRRKERILYGSDGAPDPTAGPHVRQRRELLITGARGTLGKAFARICARRGLAFRLVDRKAVDIADAASVEAALESIKPWAVVNAAGYCRVDDAEAEQSLCHRENVLGPTTLAQACAARGVPLVTFSSDLVFDGRSCSPYRESDAVAPLCVYGHSKANAERGVLRAAPGRALIVRTSAFFGPWDEHNFVTLTLRALGQGDPVHAAEDLVVSPTYVPDLAHASLDLLIDGAAGVWHLANEGATSWADLAQTAAGLGGYPPDKVVRVQSQSLGLKAARPAYSALGSERGSGMMPPLDSALARYTRECELL